MERKEKMRENTGMEGRQATRPFNIIVIIYLQTKQGVFSSTRRSNKSKAEHFVGVVA